MKLFKLTCAVAIAAAAQASAATAYIDLGDRDNDLNDDLLHGGNYWTTIDSDGNTENLKDSVTNLDTGWDLGVTGVEGDSPNSTGLVGHVLEPGVTDGLWNRPSNAFIMTISGLDGSGATTYDLSIFGNRSNNANAGISYSVVGNATTTYNNILQGSDDGNDTPTDMFGIQPDGSGVITISMTLPAGGHDLSIISTMSITSIPEPSTTALLGLGGLALILRRKK